MASINLLTKAGVGEVTLIWFLLSDSVGNYLQLPRGFHHLLGEAQKIEMLGNEYLASCRTRTHSGEKLVLIKVKVDR